MCVCARACVCVCGAGSLTEADVGKRVKVQGYACQGTLRFLGMHHDKGILRAGVELDEPIGKNNGTVGGHTYFACKERYGILCAPSKVSLSETDDTQGSTETFGFGSGTDDLVTTAAPLSVRFRRSNGAGRGEERGWKGRGGQKRREKKRKRGKEKPEGREKSHVVLSFASPSSALTSSPQLNRLPSPFIVLLMVAS